MNNKKDFSNYINVFLKQNSMLNLISKNDEKFLWEKHIFDSLSIEKFFEKYPSENYSTLADIGTGGGFPAVPIAIKYPDLKVYAIDSIRKKINAVENIKSELNLKNLECLCGRVENLNLSDFDLVTSRAVAPMKIISQYAIPITKKGGYFIAYKSVRAEEEIKDAKSVLKNLKAEVTDVISYDLPLDENFTRKLVVIKKC